MAGRAVDGGGRKHNKWQTGMNNYTYFVYFFNG